MTARVQGKVALITGAARGLGRSHAVRLAEEGADIIALDVGEPITSVHSVSVLEDLQETVRQVELLDRRIVSRQVDVRDFAALEQAVGEAVAELGRLDIVVANAGITTVRPTVELSEEDWQRVLDVNLTGTWHTVKATVPHIRAGDSGGSIVLTGSLAGIKGIKNLGHYAASKHGVIGLMRTLAAELGPEWIRVNSVHPTTVDTPLIMNEHIYKMFSPDLENPTREDLRRISLTQHVLPIPWVDPVDVSNAVLFLASDEARYITGTTLRVDAGDTLL